MKTDNVNFDVNIFDVTGSRVI